MACSSKQSLTRQRLLAAVILATSLLLPLSGIRAEIILDDFDDPFEITTSEINGNPIMQAGIGPLGVERWSEIFAAGGSEPTGSANVDLSVPSTLTFEIDHLNPDPGRLPIVALNLRYFFDEMDFTEGGINDRVAIDFVHLRSAIPIPTIHVFIQDASQSGISYVGSHFDLAPRDESFTLEFPFDSFSRRGGGAGNIDFSHAYHLILSIQAAYFSNIDEIDFSAVVERVRITHAIPEPRTGVLAWFAAGAAILFLVRERSVCHAGQGQFTACRIASACRRHICNRHDAANMRVKFDITPSFCYGRQGLI